MGFKMLKLSQQTAVAVADVELTTMDFAGEPVVLGETEWRLNHPTSRVVLHWNEYNTLSEELLIATKMYIRHLVETQAARSVYNTFRGLAMILETPQIRSASSSGQAIGIDIFRHLLARKRNDNYRVHYVRSWYIWCAAQRIPQFDPDVAFHARALRIEGNRKGRAVLSADPDDGPLTDLETTCFLNALRAARSTNVLSVEEQAALWMCVTFGANPQQIVLLRTSDVSIHDDEGVRFIHVDVPRMKKRHSRPRIEFRSRRLNTEIGDIILKLIERNKLSIECADGSTRDLPEPLFMRMSVKQNLIGTPFEDYALHYSALEFWRMVKTAAAKLSVKSHRTGLDLRLTPRRLRYTFATRLVREGVPKREVADLLDHTDLQSVQVYFDIKSDIVPKLDKAMAMSLGPMAQAFMGKLVEREADAKRGGDPTSRIAVLDKEASSVRPVGTCGSFAFCRLMAPVACYTCTSFQPWMDGPHHLLLDDLLNDRERKVASGKDGRMVAIMDDVILAVGDVISRIESAREGA